jgi:hypothetical protein
MEEQPMHEIRTAEPAGYAEFLADQISGSRKPSSGHPWLSTRNSSFFIGKSAAKFCLGRTAKAGARRSSIASPPT